jgi:hypothetical protein
MSLFGYFVLASLDRPLYEHPAIHRLCSESDEEAISSGTLANLRAEGPWQFLQVLGGWSAKLADELMAQTGAPAMSIYVVESEFWIIEARTADGARWWGYLNPDAAVNSYDRGVQSGDRERRRRAADDGPSGWAYRSRDQAAIGERRGSAHPAHSSSEANVGVRVSTTTTEATTSPELAVGNRAVGVHIRAS